MADSLIAIKRVLLHEGGYNDIKEDNGGATNYGISLRFYQQNIKKEATNIDIKNLSRQDAINIYEKYFWLPNYFQLLNSQKLANKLFDMCVNMGSVRAVKILLEALEYVDYRHIFTIGLINELNDSHDTELLIKNICLIQKKFYEDIVKNKPNQSIFLNGWLKRAGYSG
jgi:lysozyme family protein